MMQIADGIMKKNHSQNLACYIRCISPVSIICFLLYYIISDLTD